MGGNDGRGSSGGAGKLWEAVGKLGEIMKVVIGEIRRGKYEKRGSGEMRGEEV